MMFEEQYDKKITDLYLVCMHPDNSTRTYDRIQVPILTDDKNQLLQTLRNIIQLHLQRAYFCRCSIY